MENSRKFKIDEDFLCEYLLKPCPFCGEHAWIIYEHDGYNYSIGCCECCYESEIDTLENCLKWWNRHSIKEIKKSQAHCDKENSDYILLDKIKELLNKK